jgi:hypothetical protein
MATPTQQPLWSVRKARISSGGKTHCHHQMPRHMLRQIGKPNNGKALLSDLACSDIEVGFVELDRYWLIFTGFEGEHAILTHLAPTNGASHYYGIRSWPKIATGKRFDGGHFREFYGLEISFQGRNRTGLPSAPTRGFSDCRHAGLETRRWIATSIIYLWGGYPGFARMSLAWITGYGSRRSGRRIPAPTSYRGESAPSSFSIRCTSVYVSRAVTAGM